MEQNKYLIDKEEQQAIINKHISKRNIADVYTFALLQLIASNQKEEKEAKANIGVFEEKYRMNYGQFCEQFHSISAFSMFEKEDDSLDWQMETERLKSAKQDNEELQGLLQDNEQ